MSDVVIFRRRRTKIESRTAVGAAWIIENFTDAKATVEIALELCDEVESLLAEEGIEAEVH